MNTLVLEEPGRFKWKQTEKPVISKPQEVLVKVKTMGVCGTDIHAFGGNQPFFSYPRVLGHELAVEVVEIGEDVQNLKVGDLCSVEPYLNCGECHACNKGKSNCCETLKVLGVHVDGGMTDYLVLPADKLYSSSKLSETQLALVETLGIGSHAVSRAQIKKGDKVLVIGAGPIGLCTLEFAQLAGAECTVYDIQDERVAFARAHNKADYYLSAGSRPTENDYDVVLDATGNPLSMKEAIAYVGHGGKLVFVGLFIGDYSFHDPYFHKKELTLLSSRNGLPEDFKSIIHLMESGQLNIDYMISEVLPFSSVTSFFENLEAKSGLIKAVIQISN